MYDNDQLLDQLAHRITTRKASVDARTRVEVAARDRNKCGMWKKIARQSAATTHPNLRSERKLGSKKRVHNDQTFEEPESKEMGEKKRLRRLARNTTSSKTTVVAADQPCRSQ